MSPRGEYRSCRALVTLFGFLVNMRTVSRSVALTHVVFDFDGTLSWMRHGWPSVMLSTCLRYAPSHWQQDSSLCRELLEDILSLNGKPSVNQIRSFCQRVGDARVISRESEILREYAQDLRAILTDRLRRAALDPDAFLVWGAMEIVRDLHFRGLKNYIVSGTVQTDVMNEAKVLGLVDFFPGGIIGAPATGEFSKMEAIDQILADESIVGSNLVIFGDGPVEIACGKSIGALTIGIASDEATRGSHRLDPIKMKHLSAAGADIIVADYADREGLLRQIFGDENSGTGSVAG
jgi:phosphoglycolate phosphatase